FLLATGHILFDRGPLLRWSDAVENSVPEPFVLIHPDDARKAGLAHGQLVRIESSRVVEGAGIERIAHVSDRIVPGVVWAPLNLGGDQVTALFEEPGVLPRVRVAAADSAPALTPTDSHES
ncbi:MAG TPA: molybdopterin dinucleotide binding domain-containing protein, partial [Anaerolineae bacterium]|nr:molybdopterin dinucleotide binding domain-containing protein [Anaerolineae bacterium]